MMKVGPAAYSNFDIAAYLTEIILLGCIATRVGEGVRMEWDGPNMKSPNVSEAAKFVKFMASEDIQKSNTLATSASPSEACAPWPIGGRQLWLELGLA